MRLLRPLACGDHRRCVCGGECIGDLVEPMWCLDDPYIASTGRRLHPNLAIGRLKEDVASRLRLMVFDIVFGASTFLRDMGTGEFVTIGNQHCQRASTVLLMMLTLVSIYLAFVVYGAMMMSIAPIATILSFFGVIMARILQPFSDRAKAISQEIARGHEDFGQYLLERSQSWRLIKLEGALDRELERTRTRSVVLSKNYMGNVIAAARMQLVSAPMAALFALTSLFVAVEVLSVKLAEVTLFVIVILRLLPVFESFLRTRQSFASVTPSLYRVEETIVSAREAREEDFGTLAMSELRQSIRLESATYKYPDSAQPALSDIELELPARQIIAITGPSGAGKSTLVDLLPRLIEPSSGTVYFDDVPARDFTLASLRRQIAYVPQQPILFDGTVSENVAYAKPDASPQEIQAACESALADEFISRMPDQYETHIGEGGVRLSGGERQRLVLARAYLSDASILISTSRRALSIIFPSKASAKRSRTCRSAVR